jgi:RimJ/RimL family protein N-acetyltransferase
MPVIDLLAWDETGFALLAALNTADQKRYLGGPESAAKLRERHARYLTYHRPGDVEMLRIAVDGAVVGSIGYWQIERDGAPAYETGWEILSAWHGRGIGGGAAALLLARLAPLACHAHVYAFPTPDNPGSNGICRRLGFTLLTVEQLEYPAGVFAPHNIWRLDLSAFVPPSA